MKRIWHHYLTWEDYRHGMWRVAPKEERAALLPKAIKFTGNTELYGSYMLKVLSQWPIACEHNLSDRHQNRKAWLGHAACCLALGCPEDITRDAWGYLSQQQQDEANIKAQQAIDLWVEAYEAKNP